MFNTKLAVAGLVSLALIPGAAIYAAGDAVAQPIIDQIFVDVLCDEAGICNEPSSTIAAAVKVCHDMRNDAGYTDMVAAYDLWRTNYAWSEYQAGFFVGASMAAYCPEQTEEQKGQAV